ncbi:MAG: hypothetical protein FJZ56_04515 [Chlamydiae bacterium]|nr:hypothetical protein [Chlamydiota bacterium]
MEFKVEEMFQTVKHFAYKANHENFTHKEIKQQLLQTALLEARNARSCAGQVRFVRITELLYEFVQGLYHPINHPVTDLEVYSRSMRISKGADIACHLHQILSALETTHAYTHFARKYAFLLGMAKADLISKKGESLLFVADLFKIYYEAFSQVMETFCDCK